MLIIKQANAAFKIAELKVSELLFSDNLKQISRRHFELMLKADPDRQQVESYLLQSRVFVGSWLQDCIGLMVVTEAETSLEVKNIAVDENFQNRGVAKKLIQHCQKLAFDLNKSWLQIATGNSSLKQLALYQKCGFRFDSIEKNFFANYPKPIIENGIHCLDKIILRMPIKKE